MYVSRKSLFLCFKKENIRFNYQNVRIGKEVKGRAKKNRCMAGISQRYT